jgi:hypothetical protein
LYFFFYFISIGVVGRIANGLAYLLSKIGSPELWQALHTHLFARALAVGLLAGLVPLQTWIAATGVLNPKDVRVIRRLNPDRLKPWTFVFLSPVLLLVLGNWTLHWIENSGRYESVFRTSSPYHVSELFKGFLSTDCSSTGGSAMFWGDTYGFQCMIHAQLIAVWLIALGYSLAPYFRKMVLPFFTSEGQVSQSEPQNENIEESKMAEKIDTK